MKSKSDRKAQSQEKEIARLRGQLDKINLRMLALLLKRNDIANEINRKKKTIGRPKKDPTRIKFMLEELHQEWSTHRKGKGSRQEWQLLARIFEEVFMIAVRLKN